MEQQLLNANEINLEAIVANVVKIPGIRVNRDDFLNRMFRDDETNLPLVLEKGPIGAGYSRELLLKRANKLILKRTGESSIASFLAGLPGGIAMVATIPADILQFFGMALRLAQELAYLYGAQDLWQNGEVDDERVKNQLIMYCGVMFGVSGATAGVRVLSARIATTTLKKLPQRALTKTFWYPIVKQIGKAVGVRVTKSTVAKGVSKAIPVVGGVLSGGLNFASMIPMARRLNDALDSANFGYTEEQLAADCMSIEQLDFEKEPKTRDVNAELSEVSHKVSSGIKKVSSGVSGLLKKKYKSADGNQSEETTDSGANILSQIEGLSKLKDMQVITQEEFEQKKTELLARL